MKDEVHEFSVVDITQQPSDGHEFGALIGVIVTENVPSSGDYISFDIDAENDQWSQHYIVKRIEWYSSRKGKTKGERGLYDVMDVSSLSIHVAPVVYAKS